MTNKVGGRRILTFAEVLDRSGFRSKTHMYRLIAAGAFPQPVPIGVKRVGFLENEFEAWLDSRIQLRETRELDARKREIARAAVSHAPQVRAKRGAEARPE